MTTQISEIVDVNISLETQAVTQEGFGTPMILGDNATFPERIRTYTTAAEVLDDFLATDEEYLAAVAVFSQETTVEELKIGKMAARVAQVQLLDFDVDFVLGNIINLNVDGVAIGPIPFNTDHATTAADLEAALEATAGISTVVVAGNNFTITAAIAGVPVEITDVIVTGGATQPVGTLTVTVANHGVSEDLAEIQEIDNDWYGLVIQSTAPGDVLQAAAWIETERKIFATRTNDADALTTATDDIASMLKDRNYRRTFVTYNFDSNDFIDAAWLGKCLPFTPGSLTWKFKTLSTIIADNITDTQAANARDKNLNLYRTVAGRDITSEGYMASGHFIDIIHGTDKLQSDLETDVFTTLANSPKVPYTDGGVTIIEGIIRSVLERHEKSGFLTNDPKYTVTAPRVADVSFQDRANRLLPDVKFNATLAGAIHKIVINGTVTV